jgi:ATP-dependent DNA helicase RecG
MTEPLTLRDLDAIGVERIKGVGEKKLASLHDIGINSVLDLLTTYPRRWVDRTNEARVSDLLPGQEALVLVSVRSVSKRPMRNRRTMVNVVVGDGSGRLQVVFFNQPWREKQLREGLQVALFGRAEVYRGGLQMTNPVVDLIGDRTGRIVPVYPQSEKANLMTWEIAGWVEDAQPPRTVVARHRIPLDPCTRNHCRERTGSSAACVRRVAAGADDVGDAQADAGTRGKGHSSYGRRAVD